MPQRRIFQIFFAACALNTYTPQAKGCLRYEPNVVSLSGIMVLQQAFGAPGFGEDPQHDATETYEALKLESPICIDSDDKDELDANEKDVRLVQLVFLDTTRPDLAGAHAIITGTLFHAIIGHHHTPVLLAVERIQP